MREKVKCGHGRASRRKKRGQMRFDVFDGWRLKPLRLQIGTFDRSKFRNDGTGEGLGRTSVSLRVCLESGLVIKFVARGISHMTELGRHLLAERTTEIDPAGERGEHKITIGK